MKNKLPLIILFLFFLPGVVLVQGQDSLTITVRSITTNSSEITIEGNIVYYSITNGEATVTINLDATGDIAIVNISKPWFYQTPQCPNAPYILSFTIGPGDTQEGPMEIRVWDKEENFVTTIVTFVNNNNQESSSSIPIDSNDNIISDKKITVITADLFIIALVTFVTGTVLGSYLTFIITKK